MSEKLTIRLEKETDAEWALPEIAQQIMEGFVSGECRGAKWWMEVE